MLAVVILNDTPDFSWWISAIGGHPGRLDSRRELRDSGAQGLRLMSKPGSLPRPGVPLCLSFLGIV